MEIKVYKKCYLVKRNYMEYKVYNISDNKKIGLTCNLLMRHK